MTKQIDELMELANDVYAHKNGAFDALRTALEAALKPDPSCDDVKLAEKIMSDCGHNTNDTHLLERITNRIAMHTSPPVQPDVKPGEPIGYRYKYKNCFGNVVWSFEPPSSIDTQVLETVPVYTAAPPAQTTPPPRLAIGQLCEAIKKSRGYVTDDEVVMARAIESAVRRQFGVNDE
jgi:hypothetical protein